jgi:hypothetical protein
MNPNMCEDLGSGLDFNAFLAVCQNCHLRESINDHDGQVFHGYRLPSPIQSRKRGVYPLFLDGGLGNGRGGGRFDVLAKTLSKIRPKKMLMLIFHYLFYTEMSCFPAIMSFPDNILILS